MAFKQKSGSPFQRNFGIGNSPVKDMKKGVEIDGLPHNTNSEDKTGKLSEDHDERKHSDKSPAEMKSPMKKQGDYAITTDELTGELTAKQIPEEEHRAGPKVETRWESAKTPESKENIKRLYAENKIQSSANALTLEMHIQRKVNEGRELSPEELRFQKILEDDVTARNKRLMG